MSGEQANQDLITRIEEAAQRLRGIVALTPLQRSNRLSAALDANVLIKREDLQEVRSFKIRGAYNKIASLTDDERGHGVVCASAGNHAQGVASACRRLGNRGTIFMPVITPTQKITRVKQFGGEAITVELVGASFDEADQAARQFAGQSGAVFVHPFDDPLTIAGQGTVGKEVAEELGDKLDVVIAPIGGGGLIAGMGAYLKHHNPNVSVLGVEPSGSASMAASLRSGRVVTLEELDTFVEGVAVKTVGQLTFDLCRRYVEDVVIVPEGEVCTALIELYQHEGIIAEPAGALSVAALGNRTRQLQGKTIVCVLSGGNNDILRYPEIMERSLVSQGRKHYFLVEFAQKPGQLRQFVDQALGPTDDIVRFEYIKKTNKERGAALVGIELSRSADLEPLLQRMREIQLNARRLDTGELLYDYLI